MTEYFYGRVSTDEQNLASQEFEAERAGIPQSQWYTEKASGLTIDRPVLQRCLRRLKEGDVLVVTRMDRLSRRMKHSIQIIDELTARGVKVHCLLEPHLSTTTAAGEFLTRIMASVSEYEVRRNKERQREGIERAKNEGKYKGGKRKLSHEQRVAIYDAHIRRGKTASELAKAYKVSARTISRVFQDFMDAEEEKDN